MAELLPDMDVAVRGQPRAFLLEMARLGSESGLFEIEEQLDRLGEAGFDIVNFRYLGSSQHDGIGGQLIARPDVRGRILLEMRAEVWRPHPPTRMAYCDAARTIMWPILSMYNRANGSRYRFRISNGPRDHPKLSARSVALLDRFALLANRSSLHPLDWKRFYALVRDGRQEFSEDRIRGLLAERGFTPEKAEYLADIYVHLRAFKRVR